MVGMHKRLISAAFPIIVAGTVAMLVACVAVQQDLRQSANDPQIELAEDAAAAIHNGYPLGELFAGSPHTDTTQSLAPFIMTFDSQGAFISSSASDGSNALALPPTGIFDYVRAHGEDHVTWQTADGLRFAIVVTRWSLPSKGPDGATSTVSGPASSGFIVAARSLREVEVRESQLSKIMLAGWVLMVAATIIAVYAEFWWEKRKGSKL